jgi:murein DD-endopeptidase MepM/ murein hydrolase activator NlpD
MFMLRKWAYVILFMGLLVTGAAAGDYIKWVDFDVPTEALETAMELDIDSQGTEKPLRWTEILALAATHNGGGKVSTSQLKKAAEDLSGDKSVSELLGDQKKYYDYYLEAYEAVLGGLLGSYAVKAAGGEWKADYGLKAFCPVAAGWGYSHYQDFGAGRTFGYKRRHLGNDLMGSLGTPIAAVEGGTVEALGWNRYGGWRVGVRSFDGKRYYYYAHLRKDAPYAPGLQEGDTVQAGDIIGFMGRTGYSDTENTNNIDIVHLHFGLELIFDESQKDSDQEIWVDVYPIVELLSRHRVTVVQDEATGAYRRAYEYVDLDRETLPA